MSKISGHEARSGPLLEDGEIVTDVFRNLSKFA